MKFERDYFVGGKRSNYVDYREKDYTQLAYDIINILGLNLNSNTWLLDYGCATGELVRCLRHKGYQAYGTDISFWAIEYGRQKNGLEPNILQHYNRHALESRAFQAVLFLDVLEHMEVEEAAHTLRLCNISEAIIRVPVTLYDDGPYIFDVHEDDETHIIRKTKTWWLNLFNEAGYTSSSSIDKSAIYESEGMLCRRLDVF